MAITAPRVRNALLNGDHCCSANIAAVWALLLPSQDHSEMLPAHCVMGDGPPACGVAAVLPCFILYLCHNHRSRSAAPDTILTSVVHPCARM